MAADPARVERALHAAQEALQRGDIAGAHRVLLDADPGERQPQVRYTLGMLDCMRGDFIAGEARLRSVAEAGAEPALHAAWLRARWLGGHADALERTRVAASRFDASDALHGLLGEMLDAANLPHEAADAHAAAAARNPRDPGHWLRLAHALHLRADLDGAERALRSAQAAAPADPRVLVALADVLVALGRHAEALRCAEQAIALTPRDALPWRLKAAAASGLGRNDAAREAIARALALQPGDAAALQLRGLILQAGGDLAAAAADFAAAMPARFAPGVTLEDRLHRYWSRAKLRHDVEQLEYLAAAGDPALDGARAIHRAALAAYPHNLADDAIVPIPTDAMARLGNAYNRASRIEPAPRVAGSALGGGFDGAAVEADYAARTPGITWIDGFLSPDALAALQRYCLRSTFWFDFQHPNGYLGASLQDGFAAPLLLQIEEDLRARLPHVVGPHRLTQLWAFKYDARPEGTGAHADLAAINLNFWITPDEANLEPEGGGLVVWDQRAPAEWGFSEYNGVGDYGQARIARFLQDSRARAVQVPYRCNRAVLFNSDLFHRTDRIAFRQGYANRRINITMLFGHRGVDPR